MWSRVLKERFIRGREDFFFFFYIKDCMHTQLWESMVSVWFPGWTFFLHSRFACRAKEVGTEVKTRKKLSLCKILGLQLTESRPLSLALALACIISYQRAWFQFDSQAELFPLHNMFACLFWRSWVRSLASAVTANTPCRVGRASPGCDTLTSRNVSRFLFSSYLGAPL